MNPLWAALAGAAAGGLVQSLLRVWERHASRMATYRALAAEIRLLCTAARRELMLERYDGAARHLGAELWQVGYLLFSEGMSLTLVFDANVGQLGHLKPSYAEQIVQFYFWANMIQTVAGPNGGVVQAKSEWMRRRNLAYLAFSRSMLEVGDRICSHSGVSKVVTS